MAGTNNLPMLYCVAFTLLALAGLVVSMTAHLPGVIYIKMATSTGFIAIAVAAVGFSL